MNKPQKIVLPDGYKDSLLSRQGVIRLIHAQYGSDLQIVRIYTKDGQAIAVVAPGIPHTRPEAQQVVRGSSAFTASDLGGHEAHANRAGRTLVAASIPTQTLITAEISPAVKEVRARVAKALKVLPFELDVTATWHAEYGLNGVFIQRLPHMPVDKIRAALIEALEQMGGTRHWKIQISPVHGAAKMLHQFPDALPKIVSLADFLPVSVKPDEWKMLPLGVGPQGETVCQDLTATPHGLVAGPTGSGKTIALTALACSALMRGHQLVMIDPTKGGLDFLALKPFCLAWATTIEGAADAIQQIYAEGMRRKAVLAQLEVPNWQSAPDEAKRKRGLRPMTVIIDEFGSLALEIAVSKSLPKDDPLTIEMNALNAAKSIIKTYVGKFARELRFVGIFLQVALQRPDTAIMGSGELRSNLGMRTQLVPPTAAIENTALSMLFESDMLESVRERIETLADGSHGLAVIAGEGGLAQGVKVPYSDPGAVREMLQSRGVPFEKTQYRLAGEPGAAATPAPAAPAEAPAWMTTPAQRDDPWG